LNFADLKRSVDQSEGVASLRSRVQMWMPLQLDQRGLADVQISIVDENGKAIQAVVARLRRGQGVFKTNGSSPVVLIPPSP
jgi:hypothetical protein